MLAHQVSDSILNDKRKYQIQQIENTFTSQQQSGFLSKIGRLQWMIFGLAVTAILVITLLFLDYLHRLRNTKSIIEELESINLSHTHDLLSQFDEHNTSIGHLIANLIGILKTCAQNSADRQIPTTQLARQIKESIVDVADSGFWDELRSYLDHEHDNMISRIADNPVITKKDLKLIELSCVGFSYLEIAMILDYSPRYVLNKRKTIAQKLGLQKPLPDYLNDLMTPKGE
jgi:DNA-binding CsgD family transcriptional regulator